MQRLRTKFISVMLIMVMLLSSLPELVFADDIEQALLLQDNQQTELKDDLNQVEPYAINRSNETTSTIVSEVYKDPSPRITLSAASTVDPVPSYAVVSPKQDEAPYTVNSKQESISTLSGDLSVNDIDFTLPGRNGMSFALRRMYTSTSSQVKDLGGNQRTLEEYLYPIGKGWSWDLPYVTRSGNRRYLKIMGSGMYEIGNGGLLGYPWKDVTITSDSAQIGDFCSTRVKFLSGITYCFGGLGFISRIFDEYNNSIKFEYSPDGYTGGYVLSTISDDIGNKIEITYSNQYVILTSNQKKVVYTKTLQNDTELLTQVVDALGRTTTYDYAIKEAKYNLHGENPINSNPYALLTGVTHPTGAKSVYTYEDAPVTRYIGRSLSTNEYMTNQAFRMKSREDQLFMSDGSTQRYSVKNFSYNGDMSSSWGRDEEFSTVVDDGLAQSTLYFKKHFVDEYTPSVFYNTKVTTNSTYQGVQYGVVTDYKYDEVRRLPVPDVTKTTRMQQGETSPIVVQTSSMYDDYGNVTQSTDAMGNVTNYGYDANHLLTSVSKPIYTGQTQFTSLKRDSSHPNKIISQQVFDGGPSGQKLAQTDYENIDPATGNVGQIRVKNGSARDAVTQIEYSPLYNYAFPTKTSTNVTDANGKSTVLIRQYEYDAGKGKVTKYVDSNNNEMKYEYDSLNRITRVIYPDSSFNTIQYDDFNNAIRATDETGVQSYVRWNPLGWKVAVGVNEQLIKATYHYDAYGRVDWSEDALGHVTKYGYDQQGRQNKVIYPDNKTLETVYDDFHHVKKTTDPEGYSINEYADVLGRILRKEEVKFDSSTASTLVSMEYDYAGNMRKVTEHVSPVHITQYGYDPLGRLQSVTNAKNETTTYQYNWLGELAVTTYPDGKTKSNTYDEMGRLIQTTDANSKIQKIFYDANGNQTSTVDRNGTTFKNTFDNRNLLRQSDVYDAQGQLLPSESVSYSYDLAGRRTSMTDITGITSYAYDPTLGVLSKTTYPDGRTLQYSYDAQGNLESLNDPFGANVYYGYDSRNRLKTVGSTMSDSEADYSYYGNNLLKQIHQANGVTSDFTYDGLRLNSLIEKKSDSSALNTFNYTYDNNGNQLTKMENGAGYSFSYDPLNRISTSSQFGETFTYDNRGNRIGMTSNNSFDSPDSTYTYDKRNRLTNVVTKNGSNVSYRYNGDGLLWERLENGQTTRYYNNGSQVIAEGNVVNGISELKARYIRGNGLVAREDSTGKAYYVQNSHGDVVNLMDSTGRTKLNSYQYDIWGNIVSQQENTPQPFKYSGEMFDDATGLQYLRARWYDPSMGRFVNEDSYEGQIDNPLSLNLYTYVENNPLTRTDPSGHCWAFCGEDAPQQAQEFCNWLGCQDIANAVLEYPGDAATVSTVKSLPELLEEASTIKTSVRLFQIRHNIFIKAGSLDNIEARIWYLEQESHIPEKLDQSLSLVDQAKQAFNMRNDLRTKARELMSDRDEAEKLTRERPNLTWEQIVEKKIDEGYSGDDLWKAIIESSQKSNAEVNKSLGVTPVN